MATMCFSGLCYITPELCIGDEPLLFQQIGIRRAHENKTLECLAMQSTAGYKGAESPLS